MSVPFKQDIRSNASDTNRFRKRKAKWSRGGRPAPGKHCVHEYTYEPSCKDCTKRPVAPNDGLSYADVRWSKWSKYGEKISERRIVKKAHLDGQLIEIEGLLYDLENPATCPCGRCSPIYLFETIMNSDGEICELNEGEQTLFKAVDQAVQQFESHETEKLVENEYDLVSMADDDGSLCMIDDEFDFELISDTDL